MAGYFDDRRSGNGRRPRAPGPRMCDGCKRAITPSGREVEAVRMTSVRFWLDARGDGHGPHETRTHWYHMKCWPKYAKRRLESMSGVGT